ncbi:MAG: hypothetical protein Q8941_24360 [Bacteroidota bacterium]|nr:hypothetical protein [Bacteroidota bacterium]
MTARLNVILPGILFLLQCNTVFTQSAKSETAIQVMAKAMTALGNGWDTVHTLKLEGYGNRFIVDQSERFEGPYIPYQTSRLFTIDIDRQIAAAKEETNLSNFSSVADYVLNANSIALKNQGHLQPLEANHELQDWMLLAPETILKIASQSGTLKLSKDTVLQKAGQYVISFKYNNFPVRLFLNKETNMLTAAQITKPQLSGYAGIWGDSRKTVFYSFWNLLGKNIHYPLQTDTYLDDYYIESFLVNKWTVNLPFSSDSLVIPDSIKQQAALAGKSSLQRFIKRMNSQAKEIAKDIWLLPGPCNTTVVKQQDGVVVIESSYSSEYGDAIIKKVKELYPGEKIKAFIATSDAWLHLGGIRPFATGNISFYFPYRNEPLLTKVLDAPYITNPDSLARKGKGKVTMNGVKNIVTIGQGMNTIRLYPYRTETGDRMMMVFFPGHKIVYCSDLYQPKGRDGNYWQPHYAWEVYHSIKEYDLPAVKLYAMHVPELLDVSGLEKDFE